jgi:hypothetical protein
MRAEVTAWIPRGKAVVAALLIGLAAAPTGLCSLYFTPAGLVSVFSRDSLERSVGASR